MVKIIGRTPFTQLLGAPNRGMTWKTFLQAHSEVVAAADMFTIEIWEARNLVRYHVLLAIELRMVPKVSRTCNHWHFRAHGGLERRSHPLSQEPNLHIPSFPEFRHTSRGTLTILAVIGFWDTTGDKYEWSADELKRIVSPFVPAKEKKKR